MDVSVRDKGIFRFGAFRMVPVMANGQPAFAGYTRSGDGSYHAHEIVVPTVTKTTTKKPYNPGTL